MFPHLIRYMDLFIEWKQMNGSIKFVWNNLVIRSLIKVATFLDGLDTIRLLGMHTTSYGIKPKVKRKKK